MLSILLLVAGGIGWKNHVRKSQEQQCLGNMALLHSAAMSGCMEHRKGPDVALNIDDVASYVPPKCRNCPSGQTPYASFSVLQGPVCPNGHRFAPGEPRPFRSSFNVKLKGLYTFYGFTNLVDNPVGGSN
ncbi:MAG: hypothetical protein ACO1QS_21010 [Verrucomicrobiota bacterium]